MLVLSSCVWGSRRRVRPGSGRRAVAGVRSGRGVFLFRISALVACAGLTGPAAAQAQLSSELIVPGLSAPVAAVQDPTLPNVQVVVEQGGRIRVVRDGQLQPVDFLDLTPLVLSGGERGLLGLAFAPDYATSGRFFVNYTRQPDGHTVISRYRRSSFDPLRADASSRFDLLWPEGTRYINQPFANHNAGDLQFGSDGYLYVPLGDGGNANDPQHRAQNPRVLLGKILRIDVNVPDSDLEGYDVPVDNPFVGRSDVLPEIWAFGLRNPFRITVDAIARGGTGGLVIADVGQNAWEEVDYEPFGAGGRNYGWRNREGAHDNVTSLPPAFTPLVDPIVEYSRDVGTVITGGVVYRGASLGLGFFGRYFFADFAAQRLWSVGLIVDPVTRDARAGQVIEHTSELGGGSIIGSVTGFGTGADCEVYFVNWSGGELRRIVNAAGGPPAGCPSSPDPFLATGGGVFVGGEWVTRADPRAAGAGLGGSGASGSRDTVPSSRGGCTTAQPMTNWVCVGNGWVPPDHPLAGSGAAAGPGTPSGSQGPSAGGGATGGATAACSSIQPAPDWVCVGDGWVPATHPLAAAGSSQGGGTGGGSGGTGGAGAIPGNCATPDPFAGLPGVVGVCIGGGWVPSTHPLARGGG
jgi:glucose/arabinose dehydrogenase